jgi:hypothetical protein
VALAKVMGPPACRRHGTGSSGRRPCDDGDSGSGSSNRLGRYKPAATIAGFAVSFPLASAAFPEITTAIGHLREVLGDQTYESLARKGETMTTAAMVTYAYDQIDQARTELNAVSK